MILDDTASMWLFAWFVLVCIVFVWIRLEVVLMGLGEAITAVVSQLHKANREIVGKIGDLEAAVTAGEDVSGPLAALVAAAQALDDLVPDVEEAVEAEGDEDDEDDEDEPEDSDVAAFFASLDEGEGGEVVAVDEAVEVDEDEVEA